MFAVNKRPDGRLKDTWLNIQRTGEFVVNLTDEPLARAMHEFERRLSPNVGEPDYLGLKLEPSVDIKPPRLADAPWSMECKTWQVINVKDDRQLVIGEGLRFHIRDELWDPKAMRVHMERYHPVGRMFADRYCRTDDRVEFPAGAGDDGCIATPAEEFPHGRKDDPDERRALSIMAMPDLRLHLRRSRRRT